MRGLRRSIAAFAGLALLLAAPGLHAEQCPASAPAKRWDSLVDSSGKDYIPMRYRVDEQGGFRVLVAEGVIKWEEEKRLARALQKAGRISEVVLDSPGGNSYAGMAMGRLIRKRGLATRIADGDACFSACSMVFLGGVFRRVDPGGAYGVHMASAFNDIGGRSFDFAVELTKTVMELLDDETTKQDQTKLAKEIRNKLLELEQRNAKWARERANYLIEMSVSLRLMIPNIDTPAYGSHWLCRRDLRDYSVVNVE